MFSLTVLVCYRSRFAVNRETQIKAEVRKFVGKIDDIIRSNRGMVVYLEEKPNPFNIDTKGLARRLQRHSTLWSRLSYCILNTHATTGEESINILMGMRSFNNVEGRIVKGMQRCSDQRSKEMLNDVEDDVRWKPSLIQHHVTCCN